MILAIRPFHSVATLITSLNLSCLNIEEALSFILYLCFNTAKYFSTFWVCRAQSKWKKYRGTLLTKSKAFSFFGLEIYKNCTLTKNKVYVFPFFESVPRYFIHLIRKLKKFEKHSFITLLFAIKKVKNEAQSLIGWLPLL